MSFFDSFQSFGKEVTPAYAIVETDECSLGGDDMKIIAIARSKEDAYDYLQKLSVAVNGLAVAERKKCDICDPFTRQRRRLKRKLKGKACHVCMKRSCKCLIDSHMDCGDCQRFCVLKGSIKKNGVGSKPWYSCGRVGFRVKKVKMI